MSSKWNYVGAGTAGTTEVAPLRSLHIIDMDGLQIDSLQIQEEFTTGLHLIRCTIYPSENYTWVGRIV